MKSPHKTAEAFAPAKINLTLHVTGQRPDGYHLLDSLVVFADVGDRLWFSRSETLSLKITGPFASGVPSDERNLVWRAARAAGVTRDIVLEKNLPHGAGLGGGSADAAAVLRHFEVPDAAAQLGADVPVCLSAAPQRMQGVGDVLQTVRPVPVCHLVLVNPGMELVTQDVFAALRNRQNPAMGPFSNWPTYENFVAWLARQRNDLEQPARTLAPAIDTALVTLTDARLARMSGSGSTCFGLYDTAQAARNAARKIADAFPDWWVRAVETVGTETA